MLGGEGRGGEKRRGERERCKVGRGRGEGELCRERRGRGKEGAGKGRWEEKDRSAGPSGGAALGATALSGARDWGSPGTLLTAAPRRGPRLEHPGRRCSAAPGQPEVRHDPEVKRDP